MRRLTVFLAAVAFLALLTGLAVASTPTPGQGLPYYPPTNTAPRCADPSVANTTRWYTDLLASKAVSAEVVTTRVGIPFATLVRFFDQPLLWPIWNPLFSAVAATNYTLCAHFDAVNYTTVAPSFPTGTEAPHWIDQHGYDASGETFAFGWFFLFRHQGNILAYGRHTFTLRRYVDESGAEATTMQSFEKVAGPSVEADTPAGAVNRRVWQQALQESMLDSTNAFACLARAYLRGGESLDLADIVDLCHPFKP